MKPKTLNIFLSYGHDQNAELVEMIKCDLEKRGHNVWFDKSKIKAGDDWRRSITDGLMTSDKVLSFLSKYAIRDPGVCRDEIAIAIGVKGGNIQTVLVESETEVKPPVNIGHIQWLDMHNWKALYELGGNDWENWYREKLEEIIRVVESDESRRFAGEIEKLAQYLQPIQSHARINDLLNRGFFGREWLFSKVEDWRSVYSDTSRVFVLLAGAGVGKSAFAAHLAHLRGDVVLAAHFCEWNKPKHSEAQATVKSIAFQLATKFPDYRKYLLTLPGIDKLEQQSAAELFTFLVANPLSFCIDGGRQRCMILIDAVDEANAQNNQNELISLIADEFERTPHWLSLLVTSRPENDVLARLNKFNPRYIDAGADENIADIQLFLQHRLSAYDTQVRDNAIESIINKCEGNFLYAVEICNDIVNRLIDITYPEQFPAGMGNLFLNSFNRKFSGLDYNKQIAPVLEILTTALEPISVDHVCRLLNVKKRELNEVLLKTGSFFPVNDGKIKPFHKSLIDWLNNTQASERFYIDPEDSEKSMAEAHNRLFEELFDDPDTLEEADEYALQFALVHIYKAGMKKVLNKLLLQIFDAEDSMYETCKPALNALVEWVVKNKKAESERLLKNTLNVISENANNKSRLSYFFDHQGNAFKNIGYSLWALEFFEKSLKAREELVALEPDRIDFQHGQSKSLKKIGSMNKLIGEGEKALEFLGKALKVIKKLADIEPERTEFLSDLADCFQSIGNLYLDMGLEEKALEITFRSLETIKKILLIEPENRYFLDQLSVSYILVGRNFQAMEKDEEALEFYKKGLEITEKRVLLEPNSNDNLRGLSLITSYIGSLYSSIGQIEKALKYLERALGIIEKLVMLNPNRTDYRRDLSVCLYNVANIFEKMGKKSEALKFCGKSLKVIEELVAIEPGRTDFRQYMSECLYSFGSIYQNMGEGEKALAFFEKELRIKEDLVTLKPGRTDYNWDLSLSLYKVGRIYEDMGEMEKVLAFFKKSLKLMEELVVLEPGRTDFLYDLSLNFYKMGRIYKDMGEMEKALAFFEKGLKVKEDIVTLEPGSADFRRDLSDSYNYLGYIFEDLGEEGRALAFFEKSLKVIKELVALKPGWTDFRQDLSVSLSNVGSIYKVMGKRSKALEFFEISLKVMEELVILEPGRIDFQVDYADSHWNIYLVCKPDDKMHWLTKAKAILEPLVQKEITHGQLQQLWDMVNKAINKNMNQ